MTGFLLPLLKQLLRIKISRQHILRTALLTLATQHAELIYFYTYALFL